MASESGPEATRNDAIASFAPGSPITIARGPLSVAVAPAAGGRIAQIRHDGVEWLVGYGAGTSAPMLWGSYPMVPWAGRIRGGRFDFRGRRYQLPVNHGGHAVHGVAYAMPWRIDARTSTHVELSLALPHDARWPFGGSVRQRLEVDADRLRMELSVTAGVRAMPVVIGWHPWFRKPDRIEFSPTGLYPRDEEGIATGTPVAPTPGPWDDCFVNREPVVLHRAGQAVRLTSDCVHWVVYDEPDHATCVEPQSGPPDGLNLGPTQLAPGQTSSIWFLLEWL